MLSVDVKYFYAIKFKCPLTSKGRFSDGLMALIYLDGERYSQLTWKSVFILIKEEVNR